MQLGVVWAEGFMAVGRSDVKQRYLLPQLCCVPDCKNSCGPSGLVGMNL